MRKWKDRMYDWDKSDWVLYLIVFLIVMVFIGLVGTFCRV